MVSVLASIRSNQRL